MRGPSAARIVDAVADAARRFRNADFAPRVRATRTLTARTGYSEPVVDYALDRLFGGIRADVLRATIAGELGSLAALDGFVARPGRPDVFFRGVRRVAIVASRTTIGVAIPPLAFALCAKADVLVKDPGDALLTEFVRVLVQEEPALAGRVTLATWDGEDAAASGARLAEADVVVAFGADATLRAVRAHLDANARFVPFGHRTSVGYVAAEALANEAAAARIAHAVALDTLLYDGEGCLSLHALFVERGGTIAPAAFAEHLARACDAACVEFPPARDASPAFTGYARTARFRAAQGQGRIASRPAARHLIVYAPPPGEPPPLVPRTLALYPVADPAEALAFLERHALPLEAFARAEDARADVAALALASGATRLAELGTLQDPPLGGEHGGEGRILPFVRAIYRA